MVLTKAQKIQITAALIVGFMSVFAISYLITPSGSSVKVAENNMFRITIPDGESECSQCLKEFNVTFKGKAINKAIQEEMGINTSTLSSIQITNNASKNLLKVVLKDGEGNVLAIPTNLEMLTEFRKMNPESRTYVKSYEWAEFPYQSRDFYMTKDKPAQFRVKASVPEGTLVYGTIVFTFENVSLEIDPAWWVGLGSEAQLIVTNITATDIKFTVNQNSAKPYYAVLNMTDCVFGATNVSDANLTLYLPFDELAGDPDGKYAHDLSMNNNNLFTITGTGSAGKSGRSVEFTGTTAGSGVIPIGGIANLSNGFTYEFWMNHENNYFFGNVTVFNPLFYIEFSADVDDVHWFWFYVNNGVYRDVGADAGYWEPETVSNVWNHIAWIVNPATQRQLLYFNGALSKNTSLTNGNLLTAPTSNMIFGQGTDSVLVYLDEVKLYNRALTSAEVLDSALNGHAYVAVFNTPGCSYKIEENKSNYLRFGIEQTNQTFEIFPTAIVNDTGNAVLFNVTDASYYSFTPASWPGSFKNTTVYSWNLTSSIVGNDTFELNVTGISNVTRVCMGRYCNVRNPSYWSEVLKDYKDPNLELYISGEYFNGTHYIDLSDFDTHGIATNMNIGYMNGTSGWGLGKLGRGMMFDGTNDYVSVGNVINLNITSNQTISFFFTTNNISKTQTVISKKNAWDGATGYYLEYQTGGVGLGKWLFHGSGGSGDFSSTFNVTSGQWYFVVLNTSNTTASYYVDGVSLGSTPIQSVVPSSDPFVIGSYQEVASYLNGSVDEVRIHNKVLTYQEMEAIRVHAFDRLMISMPHNVTKNQNVTLVVVNGTVDIRDRSMNQPYGAGPYVAGMGALLIAYYIYRRRRQ